MLEIDHFAYSSSATSMDLRSHTMEDTLKTLNGGSNRLVRSRSGSNRTYKSRSRSHLNTSISNVPSKLPWGQDKPFVKPAVKEALSSHLKKKFSLPGSLVAKGATTALSDKSNAQTVTQKFVPKVQSAVKESAPQIDPVAASSEPLVRKRKLHKARRLFVKPKELSFTVYKDADETDAVKSLKTVAEEHPRETGSMPASSSETLHVAPVLDTSILVASVPISLQSAPLSADDQKMEDAERLIVNTALIHNATGTRVPSRFSARGKSTVD